MHAPLSTPFVDTRAGDLTWTLDHGPLPPLLHGSVEVGACRMELGILGASHQVLVQEDGLLLTETVACLPEAEGDLPERADPHVAGIGSYAFRSTVHTLAPEAFATRVQEVRERVDPDPRGIAASFPGNPNAITALVATVSGPRHVRWRTWHAYPQTGELVTTATTCVLAPPGTAMERKWQSRGRH